MQKQKLITDIYSFMRFFIYRILSILVFTLAVNAVFAQIDTIPTTSVDPMLEEWVNSRIPKEYSIAEIKVKGFTSLDSSLIISVAGLQKGQQFVYPGTDIFSRAINNLWKQKFFADIQVYITKVNHEWVSIELNVTTKGSFVSANNGCLEIRWFADLFFYCDDINHTCHRITSIQGGLCTTGNFNPFHIIQ